MSSPDGVDFSAVLAQLTRGYEPRRDAEAAILQAVRDGGSGCLLVCGEPGSGKSVLAAQLIRSHGWAGYFLRLGHTEFSLWRDPHAFLTSVAFQLQAAFGDDIFPESVAVSVDGKVRDVGPTGSVVGVDIERLVTVPWRRERMGVALDVQQIAGEVTGIRIREVVENYRTVPPGAFRELAWLDPLRRLRSLRPDAHFTLWVDGLDEEIGAAGAALPATIGALLPLASECRELGNLTVIISSRPGPHLDRFRSDGAAQIDLGAALLAQDTSRVLTALIDRELSDPATQAALAALAWPTADVRAVLLGRSEFNFLFLRQYFEAVRAGHGAALREGGPPQGLDEIHARLLSAMLRQAPADRQADLLALLEVLAVAQTPFAVSQLARFGGVAEIHVKTTLQLVRPLLDESTGREPLEYALYHKALRDCLVSPLHAAERWHVDASQAHRRIASTYFQAGGTASRLDHYGVIHGATHLAQAGAEGPETLLELLHENWRQHCRATTGSNRAFRHGLELARQHAATLPPAEACVRLIRLGLTDVYLRSAESHIPDGAFEMMVRLGGTQRALDRVSDDLEPVTFARRRAAIIRGLCADPAGDAELAATLLAEAFEKLQRRPEWMEPEMTAVLAAWPLEKADALRPLFPAIEAFVLRQEKVSANFLAARARLRGALEPATANACFQAAFDAVDRDRNEAASSIGLVLSAWAKFDPKAARDHLHLRGSFPIDRHSAAGFIELSLVLERAGWQGSLVNAAQNLLGLSPRPEQDPLHLPAVWVQILLHAPGVWAPATAAQIVDRVRTALRETSPTDAAAAGTTPRADPAAKIALRIDLAAAEQYCQRGRDAEALMEAWQAVLEGAPVADDDLDRLILLQMAADRDSIESYLHHAPASLAERLWFAVARTRVMPGSPAPAEALERWLLATEQPRATGWSFFFFALVHAAPVEQFKRSEELLQNVGVHAALITRWRIAMLQRLVAEKNPLAAEWVTGTVAQWAGTSRNANFVEELPAALARLPSDLPLDADALLASVTRARPRALLRAALAARSRPLNAVAARAEFDRAIQESFEPGEARDLEAPAVRAFIAGQAWRHDAPRATVWWTEALDALNGRFGTRTDDVSPHQGHYAQLCTLLRCLQWSAPELALPRLAAVREPPPEPGARMIMPPFPSVSPFRVAGLSEHEFLLGQSMPRAFRQHRDLVLDILRQPLSASARAYGLTQLAGAATAAALPQRVAWCQQAVAAAREVTLHPLHCLLLAEAAHASAGMGATTRALETAQHAVSAITPHFGQSDTILIHGYAAALGRCISAAIRSQAWTLAWNWLWQGRALGMHGFYVLLAEIPEAMQAMGAMSIDRFDAAEGAGRNVYVGTS